ncbi:MAG: hypothetical protein M1825_006007 [Sarcosagium campestre]|nr:MAG: hypothetical protein M1825_006007 [Sarcosagium campestre]
MSEDAKSIDDRGPAVLAVTVTVIVVSSIFVILRFISRIAIVRKVSWDDYFMILAWAISFGLSFSICYGTSRGLGRHDVDILPEWQASLKVCEYVFSVLYNPALMATKTSILIFYLNLSKTRPFFRWASIVTMVVVNAAGLALTILNIFQCRPVDAVIENPAPPSAQCIDIVTLYLSSAPVNIITDLAILFLPIPLLTSMRLPRKQKNILVFTFALGGFVAIVDVVRIAYLQQASLSRLENLGKPIGSRIGAQNDFSWYASLSYMWTAVEVNVGIICACVPTLKPLIIKLLPGIISDRGYSSEKEWASAVREGTANVDLLADQGCPRSPPTACRGSSPGGSEIEHATDSHADENPDMMEFLTTPDMVGPPLTEQSVSTRNETNAFFDFVNMKRPKSMVKMSSKESYYPLALVTVLFFLWGFAYGLLDVLNGQFQLVVEMTSAQSTGLHSAYWAGYFVAPLTCGRYILKRWGFKATFIAGLCIYGTGTLIFWPSAVLTSFPAFLISNFIVGFGLATLEVAANPFIVLCGPAEFAETRSNLAQGFQAIGSVVSPLLAQRVLFTRFQDAPSLIDVQWAYLAIALFDVLLALVFYYVPLPEAWDDDLEDIADRRRRANSAKLAGMPVVFVTLTIAVLSQFCYVGGQEVVGIEFQSVAVKMHAAFILDPVDSQTIARACFALGRFTAALMGVLINPRWILLFFYTGLVITSGLMISLGGTAGIVILILASFFESAIFPTIFAISLRGMGAHTKTASVFLTAACSGGAVFPAITKAVANVHGIQYAMSVVVAVYTVGALYPIYLNVVPAAKKQVDPMGDENSPLSPGSRASRALSVVTGQRKRSSNGLSTVAETVEDSRWGR